MDQKLRFDTENARQAGGRSLCTSHTNTFLFRKMNPDSLLKTSPNDLKPRSDTKFISESIGVFFSSETSLGSKRWIKNLLRIEKTHKISKHTRVWIEISKPPICFYMLRGIPHSYLSRLVDWKISSETSFSSESGSKICSESKNIRFCLASISFSWNRAIFTPFYFVKLIPDYSLKAPPNELLNLVALSTSPTPSDSQ